MNLTGWVVGGILGGGLFAGLSLARRRRRMTHEEGTGALVFGIFVLLWALVLGGCCRWDRKQVMATLQWPHVAGTITESRLRRVPAPDDPHQTVMTSVIRYRYAVDGTEFTGDQVTLNNTRFTGDDEAWVKRYPKGARVEVRYNPANAAQAVLESGIKSIDKGMTMAIVFGMVGLSLAVFGLRVLAE